MTSSWIVWLSQKICHQLVSEPVHFIHHLSLEALKCFCICICKCILYMYVYIYITICFYLFLHRSYRAWPIRLPGLDQITGPMVQGSPAYPNNTTWMIHVTTPWWEMTSIWRLLFDPWHCTFPIVSVCVCLCVALQKRNKNIKSKLPSKSKLLNTWSIIFISSKVGLRLPQVHKASLQKTTCGQVSQAEY